MVPLISFMQPVVGVAVGVLGRLELIDMRVAYSVLVVVALVGDAIWYWIGYRYGERFVVRYGRFFGLTSVHIHVAKSLFLQHHAPILFLSKIVNGLGIAIAILFTAGMSRVPFGRYMVLNAIGEAIWSGIIVVVGFYFGSLYVEIKDEFGRFSLVVLGLLIFIIMYCALRVIQKRFEHYVSTEEGKK